MDVHCSSCGEPWDTYHLKFDAVYETSMSEKDIQAWKELSTPQQLGDRFRREFKAAGWEFGRSVINIIRCPACPSDAHPDSDTVHLKGELEQILGDDEDGLAAAFEDFKL